MSKQIRISDTAHENLKRIAWENHRTLAATVELLARLEVDRIRDVDLGPTCPKCHEEREASHDVEDDIYDEPGGGE